MRINPGLHVVELSRAARQFGLGPDALVLRGLQDSDLAFLAALRSGLPDGAEAATARRCAVPPQRARSLTQALAPVLLPCPGPGAPDQSGPSIPGLRSERLAGDTDRLSAAYRVDGSAFMRSRARAAVEVSGLGRIGSLLARTLASAGVGTLVLSDPGVVLPADISPGYPLTDLGMGRAQAVKRQIYRLDPTVQVLPNAARTPGLQQAHLDLAVSIGGPPIAGRAPGRPAREHPHLAVTVQETGVDIGPLVVPGLTPCLECLELALAGGDLNWYAAAEALGRGGTEAVPAGEESAGAVLAAGAAAVQVLAFLDGVVQPTTWSAVLALRAADGHLGLKKLRFHPECGCRLQLQDSPAAS